MGEGLCFLLATRSYYSLPLFRIAVIQSRRAASLCIRPFIIMIVIIIRVVLVSSFVLFLIFTIGTAVVNDWVGLLVLLLFCGLSAATSLGIIGAVYADIFSSPVTRGRAMALWTAGTTFGPVCSPVISGYLGKISWRAPFWFQVIFTDVMLVPFLFLPETFAPVLLSRRAAKMRKELGREDIIVPDDPANTRMNDRLTVTAVRPVTMLFTEPIVGAAVFPGVSSHIQR